MTPEHQWWRLFIYASGTNDETSIKVIEFRSVIDGANIAIGGTASASHEQGPAYPAGSAFDGDSGTKWQTPINEDYTSNIWIAYDLGEGVTAEVKQILIENEIVSRAPTDFSLQWSDDGIDWKEVQRWQTSWSLNGEVQVFDV